jgi:hypothetical protein
MLEVASIAGGLLVGWTVIEVFWTAMGKGGGPVTMRLSSISWKLALLIGRRLPRPFLGAAGVMIVLAAVMGWIGMLWIGWSLILLGAPEAVVRASSGEIATAAERVYFAGYTLFTLGLGDFRPEGTLWRWLASLSSLNGLFLITFSVTYLIPVVQANVRKRQIATLISSLGATPQLLISRMWNGSDLEDLEKHLVSLTSDLAQIEQQHIAYPVLHYLSANRLRPAFSLGLANLDEALTIARFGMDRPAISGGVLEPAREVIERLLATLAGAFIQPSDEPPAPPSLELLRAEGIPVAGEPEFQSRVAELRDRRCLLRGLVENDGWKWEDVLADRQRTEGSTGP